MIMNRKFAIGAVIILIHSLAVPVQAATPKAGAKCTKAGATATASGKKFICVKSGKKLVWNKGVTIKAASKPLPPASPSPTPTPAPSVNNFVPWGTNIDLKILSDEAQKNFLAWVKTRTGVPINHTQVIQENPYASRISILKKADDLSAQLFSSYFPQGSVSIIGANETWTLEELAKSGWATTKCSDPYMPGVALCIDGLNRQGYVITRDSAYDEVNPGRDGAALLAHEYFHLVQSNLAGPGDRVRIKSSDADSVNAFPAWFIEGSADFIGFSVGALSQNASYWNGRLTMFSYSPNRNAISDYEIRTCCGNNSPTYPYNIGHVATEYIVASVGFQKFIDIFIDYRTTKNFDKSFANVTGISKEVFYEKFDLIRTKVGLPAISWKLDGLTNKKISG
jgi:hypothetical protein